MANAEVVRFFRRKSSTGYDSPTYLGAEQRFVGALRNSGVNNLEEQYILGTDTYTEKYTDSDGNSVVEVSYHINDSAHSSSNYYKMISITYKDGTRNQDFFFDDGTIHFPNEPDEVIFGDSGTALYPDEDTLYGNIGTDPSAIPPKKIETLIIDNNDLKIHPSSYTIIKKDELHFISGTTDILVLEKLTGKKYLDDGAREVILESIINHIS